jgi:ribosomal protein S18 acetylase RimI-like enzyme
MAQQPLKAPAFILREYEQGDFDALCSIDRGCFDPPIAYSRTTMSEMLSLPGAESQLAVASQVPVGFIVFVTDGEHGHILTIDVLGPWRRQGVGSALIGKAEERLTALGASEIGLETATDNAPAIAFWLRRGYCSRGKLKNYYRRGQHAYYMTRALGSPRHLKET